MSECPVCGKAGIDAEATRCPQCQADLECFALLDALHEGKPGSPSQRQERKHPSGAAQSKADGGRTDQDARWPVLGLLLAMLLAMVLAVLILQILALRQRPVEPPVAVPAPQMAATFAVLQAMTDSMSQLATRLDSLEARLHDLNTQQHQALEQAATTSQQVAEVAALVQAVRDAPAFASATARQPRENTPVGETSVGETLAGNAPIESGPSENARTAETSAPREPAPKPTLHHHLRPNETLWSIAKRYYGQGWLYPVLIVQNPGLGVYHQGTGILTLFADPAQALDLYGQITPPGAQGRLFRYPVQPGDDWHGLASRFLGRAGRAPELMALNPDSDLTPGSQILIPLE